ASLFTPTIVWFSPFRSNVPPLETSDEPVGSKVPLVRSVPRLTTVFPVYVRLPVSVVAPVPFWTMLPAPEIALPMLTASVRLNAMLALLLAMRLLAELTTPAVLPSPIWRTPALDVYEPLNGVSSPLMTRMPGPALVRFPPAIVPLMETVAPLTLMFEPGFKVSGPERVNCDAPAVVRVVPRVIAEETEAFPPPDQ